MAATKAVNRTTTRQTKPRKHSAGTRRFTLYVSWSYPAESGADVADVDNRFITVLEFRRAGWPHFESWRKYDQGIATQMDHGILAFFEPFQKFMEETAGHPVPLLQRVDKKGRRQLLDERVLADTDTLIVVSLDHQRTRQRATAEEVETLKRFLAREGTCLVLNPHHDVGASEDIEVRTLEYKHHGDWTVGGRQRFSGFARSLMSALGIPIENRYGLSPARVKGTREPAPLAIAGDLDTRGLLRGVTTFHLHAHLPHYGLTAPESESVRVLARQAINLEAPPHPFVQEGHQEFNALVWLPPGGQRAGDVVVCDFTLWSTFFGGAKSLEQFWRNLARM